MAVTLGSTGITFPEATTQTTAATGGVTSLNGETGAITNTNLLAIGCYVLARYGYGTEPLGTTIAGSYLNYTNFIGGTGGANGGAATIITKFVNSTHTLYGIAGGGGGGGNGSNNSGTWRIMATFYNSATLFVRVS